MSNAPTIDRPTIDRRTIDRLLSETSGGYTPVIDATTPTGSAPLPTRSRPAAPTSPSAGGVSDALTAGVLADLLAKEFTSGPTPEHPGTAADPHPDAPFFARRVRAGRGDLFRTSTPEPAAAPAIAVEQSA